jgi:diketogulonate reductase-like aldo/keto reductase
MNARDEISRRRAAKLIAGTAAGLVFPICASRGFAADESTAMLTRDIPSSGEKLPVIGLGTWQTFDIDPASAGRKQLDDVLSLFVKLGGKVVDSSPMYGRAEEVLGEIAAASRLRDSLFLATKVWTRGKQAGVESMERSLARFQTKRIDLMQVHNLVDVETQLANIHEMKSAGQIRYAGVTHYNSSGYRDVEKILRAEKLDFLQINYSIGEREAEERILPLAQERRVAVIVNRPFGGGDLFQRVRANPLPEWAAEIDCRSWAQFLLKWIVGHPAITCVIPATSNPRHLEDNMNAGLGRFPDARMRERMKELVAKF